MYVIEWLKDGAPVDRETTLMTHDVDVVASAKKRAYAAVKRLEGKEPDSFRVTNASGAEIGVFHLDGQPVTTNPQVDAARRVVKVCDTLTPISMLVV